MRFIPVIAALALVILTAPSPSRAAGNDVTTKHGIAMHGDLKYPANFTHFDYVNPNAPKDGKVRQASIGTFDSLNNLILKGSPAAGLGLIYNTLLEGSADEPFSRYGALAKKVEMPKDRSWVIFYLHKNARWHDGKPVTAEDVKFTFEILMKDGRPFYRYYYQNVDKVEIEGKYSVKFSFKPGENREMPLILSEFPILPKHYWLGRSFNSTTLEPPLGSGPYKITAVDQGRSITYTRVKDYWGENLPTQKGRHNFDEIRYDYYRDATVALQAFKAGEYDYRPENSSKAWATAYKFSAVNDGTVKVAEFPHKNSSGMQGFAFNTRRDIFKDAQVRKALAYTFNFEWCNANLFYGQYKRTRSFYENSELAATGLPSPDELKLLEPFRGQIPGEVFTKAYQPPSFKDKGAARRNLRHASKMLKEAGWIVKDGKRINAQTGQPMEFELLLVSPLFERIALTMTKNLKRLGISMRIRTVDSAQYQSRLQEFDFDMIVANWGQSLSPGNEQRNSWSSSAAATKGSRNFAGIQNPAIDAVVEKLIAAPDRKSLVTATRALDRLLQWGHYVIPQWHLNYDRLAYRNIFGMPPTIPDQGARFDTWWIK